jgi:hypothetical protein
LELGVRLRAQDPTTRDPFASRSSLTFTAAVLLDPNVLSGAPLNLRVSVEGREHLYYNPTIV